MKFAFLIPIAVGFFIIIQAGLNDKISNKLSLNAAIFWGSVVTLISASIPFFLSGKGAFTKSIQTISESGQWYWIVPGVFGFGIIFCMPLAFKYLSATTATVTLVGSQLIVSALWDKLVYANSISTSKIIAIVLALVSVGISTLK